MRTGFPEPSFRPPGPDSRAVFRAREQTLKSARAQTISDECSTYRSTETPDNKASQSRILLFLEQTNKTPLIKNNIFYGKKLRFWEESRWLFIALVVLFCCLLNRITNSLNMFPPLATYARNSRAIFGGREAHVRTVEAKVNARDKKVKNITTRSILNAFLYHVINHSLASRL